MREGEHVVKVAKGNHKDAAELIRYAQPFEASALSGRVGAGGVGYLPDEWRKRYWENASNILFTVYSYGTPISWLSESSNGAKTWTVPDVRYSRTTSIHQGLVRRVVGA